MRSYPWRRAPCLESCCNRHPPTPRRSCARSRTDPAEGAARVVGRTSMLVDVAGKRRGAESGAVIAIDVRPITQRSARLCRTAGGYLDARTSLRCLARGVSYTDGHTWGLTGASARSHAGNPRPSGCYACPCTGSHARTCRVVSGPADPAGGALRNARICRPSGSLERLSMPPRGLRPTSRDPCASVGIRSHGGLGCTTTTMGPIISDAGPSVEVSWSRGTSRPCWSGTGSHLRASPGTAGGARRSTGLRWRWHERADPADERSSPRIARHASLVVRPTVFPRGWQ